MRESNSPDAHLARIGRLLQSIPRFGTSSVNRTLQPNLVRISRGPSARGLKLAALRGFNPRPVVRQTTMLVINTTRPWLRSQDSNLSQSDQQSVPITQMGRPKLVHRDGFEPPSRRASTDRSPSELPMHVWRREQELNLHSPFGRLGYDQRISPVNVSPYLVLTASSNVTGCCLQDKCAAS